MSQPKKNNCGWLTPSFDHVPSKTPVVQKRQRSKITNDKVETEPESLFAVLPKKSKSSSLSAVLAACNPQQASELAVSRQKQQEICDWLDYKTQKGKPSVLVLSGPSGCGKTVAFKLLAKEAGFDVMEWITPIDQASDENNRVMRQGERFEDYLVRATRYSSVLEDYSRRLLLVKDIPNIYLGDANGFCSLLEKYFQIGKEPLVFVCTDTGNSRTLQTLFSQKIKDCFGINHISINAATQTVMKNIMKRVSTVLNSQAGHLMNVTQQAIDEVLSSGIGDVRSAIMNLIFSSLKVPENHCKSESRSREEGIGLLHGIGRVINPKKIADGGSWKFVHDPDEIASSFETLPTLFLRFLHENHLNTIRGIQEASTTADIMSQADCFVNEWRDANLNSLTLSFCIRGLMVTNDKPVPGWNPVRKPKNDDCKVRRDLSSAEIRWYESLINPNSKNAQLKQLNNLNIE